MRQDQTVNEAHHRDQKERQIRQGTAIGSAMGVALITTLYGAFAANFLFLPFADKLKGKNEAKKVQDALTTTGVLMIAYKKHPIEIRDALNAYLPPGQRTKEEE